MNDLPAFLPADAPCPPLVRPEPEPPGSDAGGKPTEMPDAASVPVPLGVPDSLVAAPPMAPAAVSQILADLSERAATYATQASGPGTQRAYRSAWKVYAAWCDKVGREPLSGDPGLLALYVTRRAEDGLAVSSLQVARAAVRAAHRLAGIPLDLDDARLGLVMEGITRSHGLRPRRQAAAAVPDLLRRLLGALPAPNSPPAAAPALAARHRAMLLIGFGAALRRSEIVALRVGDVAAVEGRGLTVRVRRGKTDQHGRGETIAMWANHRDPGFCPVVAYAAWMRFRRAGDDSQPALASVAAEAPALPQPTSPAADRATGLDSTRRSDVASGEKPLFCGITGAGAMMRQAMSDKVVARLIKQACGLAGLDGEKFSGHSLRRGLLTAAGDLQLPLVDLMRQSRHQSVDTARRYIEAGDAWRNNITEAVFGGKARSG